METGKVAGWLQVAGNLGLIFGLVLVGVQIYQNTEIAKIQMVHNDFSAIGARYEMMVGENLAQVWAKAISDPSSLTLDEHVVVDNILKAHLIHFSKLVRLQELGFELVNPSESSYVAGMAYYLSSTYGKSWWDENRNLVRPTVQEAISRELDLMPDNYLRSEVENLSMVIKERLNQFTP